MTEFMHPVIREIVRIKMIGTKQEKEALKHMKFKFVRYAPLEVKKHD